MLQKNEQARDSLALDYCNRTATRPEQTRTEQKSAGTKNPENSLDKRILRQSRTQQETCDLTYKEGVAGSNPASPTLEKRLFAGKT
jgi:hypothetical protein